MRKRRGSVADWGLLIVLALAGPAALAEDPAEPADAPPAGDEPAAAEPPDETAKPKSHFGLYLGVAGGFGSAEAFNTSIVADELSAGSSSVEFVDAMYGRAAIGWRLPQGKGDFRLVFQGFKEEEYEFRSVGATSSVAGGQLADLDSGLIPWWFIEVNGGDLTATRLAPNWDISADSDPEFGDADSKPDFGACVEFDDGTFRCGEISYDPGMPLAVVTGSMPDDLQNRIDTYDIVYGREFGGRRYSSRWWGGLRYFEYEGQLLAGAWLNINEPGLHYTNGSYLRLLSITQKTTGAGPVGSWEVDFNFFERALQFYVRGEASFTFNSMEMDTGPFFQVINAGLGQTLDDRMSKSQDKSSWQDRAEIGARIYLKNGLQFEIGYSISGYLDLALLPDRLQLGVTNEEPETFTQDLVIDTLHFGAGFQF